MERKTIFTSLQGTPAQTLFAAGLVLTLLVPVSIDKSTFEVEQTLETIARLGGER